MKKILCLFIMIINIPSLSFSQEQDAEKANVNVNWSGRGCRGTNGLCNIESTNKTSANATLQYNEEETLTLVIDRTKLTPEEESNLVSVKLNKNSKENDLIFIMDDDFVLENETKTILKTPPHLSIIPEGLHPIEVTEESIIISLNIK